MLRTVRLLLLCCLILGFQGVAIAASDGPIVQQITGVVLAVEAHRTSPTYIVTESQIRTDAGTIETVVQTGGEVGEVGTVELHGPALLEVGDNVVLNVVRADAGAQTKWIREIVDLRRASSQFTRAETSDGNPPVPLYWASGCTFITYNLEGTSHIANKDEFDVMDSVLNHWRSETEHCSYMTFERGEPQDIEVGEDFINTIIFREDTWCRPVEGMSDKCYSPNTAGITTISFVKSPGSSRFGQIADADIELNAVNFSISTGGETLGNQENCRSDLAGTLTHEVGHLLGLHHTCFEPTSGDPHLKDDMGVLLPTCNRTDEPEHISEPTMYNFQNCGETKKATLESDDVLGICEAYPLASDPGECKVVSLSSGCCSVAGDNSTPVSAMILAGIVALFVGNPRRRRMNA